MFIARLKDCSSPLYFHCFQVKDLEDPSSERHDVDFTTDASKITIDWFQVFSNDLGALSFFEVAIGTFPGGKLKLSRLKSFWTWNSIKILMISHMNVIQLTGFES